MVGPLWVCLCALLLYLNLRDTVLFARIVIAGCCGVVVVAVPLLIVYAEVCK